MGSAVSWGDPQPLEWCAGWEGGECNWGLGAARGEFGGQKESMHYPSSVFLQAVPEMTEILKKK